MKIYPALGKNSVKWAVRIYLLSSCYIARVWRELERPLMLSLDSNAPNRIFNTVLFHHCRRWQNFVTILGNAFWWSLLWIMNISQKHHSKWNRFVLHRPKSWLAVSFSVSYTLALMLLLLRYQMTPLENADFLQIWMTKKPVLISMFTLRFVFPNVYEICFSSKLLVQILAWVGSDRKPLLPSDSWSVASLTLFSNFSLLHRQQLSASLKPL